jgi:signal transduction histidine kinase
VENALFAIVQEMVTNALKHAAASHIRVQLTETATDLQLVIADNGKGFEVEPVLRHYAGRGSLGLLNIRERAELIGGQLSLASAPGRGTRLTVCVPKAPAERRKKRATTGSLALPPGYTAR